MVVKIKKLHPDAVIPSYSKVGDAGMDLTAISLTTDEANLGVYGTGISVQIPDGYVGLIFPRSSITKTGVRLANAVGVIDSGYRGEITMKFDISPSNSTIAAIAIVSGEEVTNEDVIMPYSIGDRIGQLIILPYPKIQFEEVFELSYTDRGTGGYGSTGT